MSKRFGRNKRRKLVQQLAILKNSEENNLNTIYEQNSKIYKLQKEIDRAKSIVAFNSGLFSPNHLNVNYPLKTIRVPVQCNSLDDYSLISKTQDLDIMILSANLEKMNNILHLRIDFKNDSYGYAVSKEHLNSVPEQILVSSLAEEFSRLIVSKIKQI